MMATPTKIFVISNNQTPMAFYFLDRGKARTALSAKARKLMLLVGRFPHHILQVDHTLDLLTLVPAGEHPPIVWRITEEPIADAGADIADPLCFADLL